MLWRRPGKVTTCKSPSVLAVPPHERISHSPSTTFLFQALKCQDIWHDLFLAAWCQCLRFSLCLWGRFGKSLIGGPLSVESVLHLPRWSLHYFCSWNAHVLFHCSIRDEASIMNPVYSPAGTGVPFTNTKGMGYPGKSPVLTCDGLSKSPDCNRTSWNQADYIFILCFCSLQRDFLLAMQQLLQHTLTISMQERTPPSPGVRTPLTMCLHGARHSLMESLQS